MGCGKYLEKTFLPEALRGTKVEEFLHKPARTLEASLIPENQLTRTAINVALGAIPGVGPALAAGWGALGGSKNVPEGAGMKGILPVAMGAASGYGYGAAGAGAVGGAKGFMGEGLKGIMPGFKSGVGGYTKPVSEFLGGIGKSFGKAGTSAMNMFGFGGATPGTSAISPMATAGTQTAQDLAASLAGGGGMTTAGGAQKGLLSGLFEGGGLQDIAAMLISGAFPGPEISGVGENLASAQEFVSKYGLEGMPSYARDEMRKWIEQPLSEVYPAEIDARFARTERALTDKWDKYRDSRMRAYTSTGQVDSEDWRNEQAQIEQMRAEEMNITRQEIESEVMDKGIQMKQFAITSMAQNGQFEASAAFEVAKMIGQQDQLEYAIAQQDYTRFQEVMAKILSATAREIIGF